MVKVLFSYSVFVYIVVLETESGRLCFDYRSKMCKHLSKELTNALHYAKITKNILHTHCLHCSEFDIENIDMCPFDRLPILLYVICTMLWV